MAPVFAHANMRGGGLDRLVDTYQRELSQGVALEGVSVVVHPFPCSSEENKWAVTSVRPKDTAFALYHWKKLSSTGSRGTGSRQCLPGLSAFLLVGVRRLQV